MSAVDGLLNGLLGNLIGSLGLGGLLALSVVTFLRSRPEILRIRADGDAAVRDDLRARLQVMEERYDKMQERMDKMREQHRSELEMLKAQHAAEMAVMRHRLNSEMQSLDALLMLGGTGMARNSPPLRWGWRSARSAGVQ